MPRDDLSDAVDRARHAQGFLSVRDVMALSERGNIILDPFSTLIGVEARIGAANILYPNVIVAGAHAVIGSRNTLHPNTRIDASAGPVVIGDDNDIGDGGFIARANRAGASVSIGNRGRYNGGCSLYGKTVCGDGSQILGAIVVTSCTLAGGDDHLSYDPDRRGAVLKGSGTASSLVLSVGQVIVGVGVFRTEDVKQQSFYHPR